MRQRSERIADLLSKLNEALALADNLKLDVAAACISRAVDLAAKQSEELDSETIRSTDV